MVEDKIIFKTEFSKIREDLRKNHKKIVLCHGVFDLLHYGHIEHLQEAKRQGDVLVVSVTAAKYVNKGPGRPYFSDHQRMVFLASLEFVDYVLLSEDVTVHKIVEIVQPDFYVKGQEYAMASNDVTGNIGSEQEIVEHYGGKIFFTTGEVYSSTNLLNNFFNALSDEVKEMAFHLKQVYGHALSANLRKMVDSFTDLNVLVVGDIIIDEYNFCNVQGVTMKDATLSTFFDYQERYPGGSLAVARHLANFAGSVTLLALSGTEPYLRDFIREKMHGVNLEIIEDNNFVTPVKKRWLKQNRQRQEYTKLFSCNHLMTRGKRKRFDYRNFYQKLEEIVGGFDAVIVCDYGHGLLDDTAIRILEEKAKFLSVNCQTNSANYGTNIITKYDRADCFVTDERELRLAFGQALTDSETLLCELSRQLGASYAWVTLGAEGALGVEKGNAAVNLPAMTLKIKDTIGAGDAFYAIASLGSVKKIPVDLLTLLSNISGAIKTNVLGNKQSVQKVDLIKFLNTVLNV